jgi:hypothetical protein
MKYLFGWFLVCLAALCGAVLGDLCNHFFYVPPVSQVTQSSTIIGMLVVYMHLDKKGMI